MDGFKVGLHAHGRAGHSGFVAQLVGDHAFERGDVRMSFAPGYAIAVQIEAHRGIAYVSRTEAKRLIEDNAFERIDRQVNSRDDQIQSDAQMAQRVAQTPYAHKRAATLLDVQRRGSDEAQSQYQV